MFLSQIAGHSLTRHAAELFALSDKYDVPSLKTAAEDKIVEHIMGPGEPCSDKQAQIHTT